MKRIGLFLMMAVMTAAAFGLDFSLTPGGFAFIPMGEGSSDPATSNTVYGMGGGGEIGFEADLSSVLPNPLGLGYTQLANVVSAPFSLLSATCYLLTDKKREEC